MILLNYTLLRTKVAFRLTQEVLKGMYRKHCDRCNRPSYSSSEAGEWLCPVCGHDLTSYPFFQAVTLEKVAILNRWNSAPYKKETARRESATNFWG